MRFEKMRIRKLEEKTVLDTENPSDGARATGEVTMTGCNEQVSMRSPSAAW